MHLTKPENTDTMHRESKTPTSTTFCFVCDLMSFSFLPSLLPSFLSLSLSLSLFHVLLLFLSFLLPRS